MNKIKAIKNTGCSLGVAISLASSLYFGDSQDLYYTKNVQKYFHTVNVSRINKTLESATACYLVNSASPSAVVSENSFLGLANIKFSIL